MTQTTLALADVVDHAADQRGVLFGVKDRHEGLERERFAALTAVQDRARRAHALTVNRPMAYREILPNED